MARVPIENLKDRDGNAIQFKDKEMREQVAEFQATASTAVATANEAREIATGAAEYVAGVETRVESAAGAAEGSAQSAEQSRVAAEASAGNAESAKTAAAGSAAEAESAASEAEAVRDTVLEYSRNAAASAQAASTSNQNAIAQANRAEQQANAAAGSAGDAADSATASETSAQNSESSRSRAQGHAEDAAAEAAKAARSAEAASASETAAGESAEQAAESARTLTVDTTLSEAGRAADAKATGDAVTELKNDLMYDQSLNDDYINGYYITTSGGTGTVIDTTPTANAGLCYQIVACRAGDRFTLTGRGGTNPRLWCFTDAEYKVISKSGTGETGTDLELTATAAGYLIVNSYIADEHKLTHSFVAGLGDLAIDTTLTESGVPADAKAAGDAIRTNSASIDYIEETLSYTRSITDNFINGYYIDTSATVGSTVDVTPVANASLCYQIVKCNAGDTFVLTGRGGTASRLWCFVDENYKSVARSNGGVTEHEIELTATKDGYFIANCFIVDEHSLTETSMSGLNDLATDKTLTENGQPADAKAVGDAIGDTNARIDTIVSGGKITHITSPEQINWRYGYYSTAGNYTKSVGSICTVIPLKISSGSIKGATHTYFQYRFVPDDESEVVYRTFKADQVEITAPGTLYIGCRPNPTGDILLRSLLDDLTVDLYLSEQVMPAGYWIPGQIPGVVPVTDYIGKHTDTSGFYQNTTWDTAMAWWRALPGRATGYVTEEDLGEVYDGKHLYAYDLIPPAAVGAGKKLPWIFIVTSVHGHEKSATYGCCYLIDDMLAHSTEDPVLFYLRNYCRLTILPCANPYGWDYDAQSGHPYEDHEHYGSRYNENGVNINRNYDSYNRADFESDETYTTPWNFNCMGTEPFSETETQAIKKALSERDEVTCFVDLHTNGTETKHIYEIAAWLFNNADDPYAGQLAIAGDMFIDGLRSHLDELYDVNKPMNQLYGTCYVNQERPDSMTWGMEMLHIPSMVFEVPCGGIEQGDDFLGPKLRKYTPDLIKCCGEMTGNMLRLVCYYLGQKMPD